MKAKIDRPAVSQSVVQQIVQLPELPMPDLKVLWRKLFRSDTPTHNRQFLERRIAHKLQEIEFYKTDRNLLDRNKRRIDALIKNGKARVREADYHLVAGTMLSRVYHGKEYHVITTSDGNYEFDVVCLCHPAIQHHNLNGQAHAQCPFVICTVRARSNRRADSGQNRSQQKEGHVDGRSTAIGVRRRKSSSCAKP